MPKKTTTSATLDTLVVDAVSSLMTLLIRQAALGAPDRLKTLLDSETRAPRKARKTKAKTAPAKPKPKQTMSPATRAKIRKGIKQYWQTRRKAALAEPPAQKAG